MTPLLYRLGHFCARHPVWVLAVWVVIALVVVGVARSVGQETNDNVKLPGTDSQAASDLLSSKFPDQANGSVPIAFRAPEGAKLSASKYKKPIQRVTKAYSKDPAITQAVGPFDGQGGSQLNKKHTIGYISLNLKDSPSELSIEEAQRIIRLDQPLDKAGLNPAAGGYLGQKVSKPSTHVSEVVGLTAAVFILLFTFGTAIAMGIPILTAILGLSVGLGIITFLSHSVEVPTSAPTLATMIGLGVGIDYALFIVTRHRDNLAGHGAARVGSPRHGYFRGSRRLRRGDGHNRAGISGSRRDTVGDDARLHGGDSGARRGLGGDHPAARHPRADRARDQPPARARHANAPRRKAPRLGPLGRLRGIPPLARP
ncbi:MAG: MMPL family transporter, partial [Actinomycetota bacterium]|nr:MMPL family transporter [Actinomycetota bacterium]